MKNLLTSLKETDAALLPLIANYWGVDISRLSQAEIAETLEETMMQMERADRIWAKLDDEQRGVLQTLIGGRGKMPLFLFQEMYGEIRKMGKGAIEREKPLENPASLAEGLFYRGMIYEGYEEAKAGARPVVYMPPDFIAVLPTHKTTYDDLEDAPSDSAHLAAAAPPDSEGEGPKINEIHAEELGPIQPADTTIVDDLTTLLAYLQVYSAGVNENGIAATDSQAILGHFLNPDEARLVFLIEIAISGQLVEVQDGRAHPRRAEARRWLEGSRAQQLKSLAEAWLNSSLYRDLWHVTGLFPDPTGWPYDPVVARGAVIEFLREFVPEQAWWSIDEFIYTLKEIEPDFQRPGGDYESWYIRNDAGDYLNGFESWDAVEGPLLEFYLMGPMHWLGMVDLGEDAARLTAYGRACVAGAPWPEPKETDEAVIVEGDGTLLISRRASRFERFQAMRFTTWGEPARESGHYTYKLSAEGVRRAAQQGITAEHIGAFITRTLGNQPVPPTIQRLLEVWHSGPTASATLENLLVLRTTSIETMDFIADTPSLRRYLGARLGPMAVIVRADEWEALRDGLGEHGIEIDVIS